MNKTVVGFIVKLMIALALLFTIHIIILHLLELPLFENRIALSYCINFMLAVGIYVLLFKLRVKYLDLLGFIYMAGSFLKFIFFFLFFYPYYRENGNMDAIEATTFMTPYVLCLFFETFFLIKLLNNKI